VWRRRVSVKGQTRLAIEFSVGDMQHAPANIAGRARVRMHPLGTKNWNYQRWSIFDSSAGEMISILAAREARRAISRESDAGSRARARASSAFSSRRSSTATNQVGEISVDHCVTRARVRIDLSNGCILPLAASPYNFGDWKSPGGSRQRNVLIA